MTLPDNALTRTFDAALRKASREALLVDCQQQRAQYTPLLLVLEDIQWLDPLSHELLEALAQAIWALPVCLLLSYRAAPHLPLRAAELPYFRQVSLGPLDQDDAETLLRAHWQAEGGEALAEARVPPLLARVQGNPFYLEELARYLRRRPEQAAPDHTLPASLASLILSRLDQLPEPERLTLRVASIIGRRFPAPWLWGYYPALGAAAEAAPRLEALTERALQAEETPPPEAAYRFRQTVTQEVTYSSLPHATRTRLHEQLARYLEEHEGETPVALLAHHYQASENLPKMREYLRRAGEVAQAAYANAAARESYEALLPLLAEADEQMEIELKLGKVLEVLGEWEAAEAHYQAARTLAAQAGAEARLAESEQALGSLQEKRGEYAAAWQWLSQAQARWEQLDEAAGRCAGLAALGMVARRQGRVAEARALLSESLEHCRGEGDLPGQARA